MAIKNYDYSCGGNQVEHKKIKFVVDDQSGVISDVAIYEGPCNPMTGEFFLNKLIKTNVKNEADIRDYIDGICLSG